MGKRGEAYGSPASSYVCVAVCGMSLSICRGKYRPETRDYQCVMPSVAPLQFSSKVKIGGRSLESTLPTSPRPLTQTDSSLFDVHSMPRTDGPAHLPPSHRCQACVPLSAKANQKACQRAASAYQSACACATR